METQLFAPVARITVAGQLHLQDEGAWRPQQRCPRGVPREHGLPISLQEAELAPPQIQLAVVFLEKSVP